MAVLTRDGVQLMRLDGTPVARQPMTVTWDPGQAERGGYPHFMLKEIHEQPRAVRDTLAGRIHRSGEGVVLDAVRFDSEWVRQLRAVYLVACGTAYHAGLIGGRLIERLAGIPAWTEIASEFRYREPLVDERTLFVAISQSGETADTLAALREARRRGARVLAITNVVGSSVAREADDVVYTWAGPEIAVASTKAYTTQLVALTLLAVHLAELTGFTGPWGGRTCWRVCASCRPPWRRPWRRRKRSGASGSWPAPGATPSSSAGAWTTSRPWRASSSSRRSRTSTPRRTPPAS